MKIAALLFIFIPFLSFSQKPNKNDVPTTSLDSIVYDLTPKTLAPSSIVLPFKSIVILDARFDTSKLGYEVHKKYEKIMYSDFKKIKLSRSIQESVQFFYNDYYNLCLRDSAYKLLIVLKTLWIDNAPRPEFAEENYHEYLTESYQDIYVRWEYYLQKKDNYYPLKKTDTTYRLSQTALALKEYKFKKNDLSFFTFVLKAEIEKINFNDFAGRIENIKAISFQTIDSFNKKRYLLPVLNSKNIQTGVFQNFEEFKNNTPQIKGYKLIKKDKGLYWVNSENLKSLKQIYLLSDSIGLFSASEKRISVIRVGNTFEFFSDGLIASSKSIGGSFLNVLSAGSNDRFFNNTNSEFVLIPRQINMETGEVY